MRCIVAGFLAAAALCAQGDARLRRQGDYWVETVTASVPLGGARQVRLINQGPIRLQGQTSDVIQYTLKKRVQAANEQEGRRLLDLIQAGARERAGWLVLEVTTGGNSQTTPELELRAPRGIGKYLLETRGGSLHAFDLDGSLEAASDGGNIEVDRIAGAFTARTGGGDIKLGIVGGIVRCITGGGSIRAARIGREIHFETGGGEIVVEQAGGPVFAATAGGNIEVLRGASTVTARTAGGLIRVLEAGGMVQAETGGGPIQVKAAKGVRCASGAGGIKLDGVSGELRASTALGSILAELLASAPLEDSYLQTGAGDITVFIPSNLAVRVEAHNQSPGRISAIVSDFPEIRIRLEGSRSHGPTVAEGVLNGGGPTLKLAASQGTIYLRRK